MKQWYGREGATRSPSSSAPATRRAPADRAPAKGSCGARREGHGQRSGAHGEHQDHEQGARPARAEQDRQGAAAGQAVAGHVREVLGHPGQPHPQRHRDRHDDEGRIGRAAPAGQPAGQEGHRAAGRYHAGGSGHAGLARPPSGRVAPAEAEHHRDQGGDQVAGAGPEHQGGDGQAAQRPAGRRDAQPASGQRASRGVGLVLDLVVEAVEQVHVPGDAQPRGRTQDEGLGIRRVVGAEGRERGRGEEPELEHALHERARLAPGQPDREADRRRRGSRRYDCGVHVFLPFVSRELPRPCRHGMRRAMSLGIRRLIASHPSPWVVVGLRPWSTLSPKSGIPPWPAR